MIHTHTYTHTHTHTHHKTTSLREHKSPTSNHAQGHIDVFLVKTPFHLLWIPWLFYSNNTPKQLNEGKPLPSRVSSKVFRTRVKQDVLAPDLLTYKAELILTLRQGGRSHTTQTKKWALLGNQPATGEGRPSPLLTTSAEATRQYSWTHLGFGHQQRSLPTHSPVFSQCKPEAGLGFEQ